MSKDNEIANNAPDALKILWKAGVFRDYRILKEIKNKLHEIGYNFTDQNLSMALKNTKFLTRIGDPMKYKYIQKYPYAGENEDG